jgi:hypothetical protein
MTIPECPHGVPEDTCPKCKGEAMTNNPTPAKCSVAGIRVVSGFEHYSVDDIEAEREGWQKAVEALQARLGEARELLKEAAEQGMLWRGDRIYSWLSPNDGKGAR